MVLLLVYYIHIHTPIYIEDIMIITKFYITHLSYGSLLLVVPILYLTGQK